VDEELVGQLSDVSGDVLGTCDLCGKPVDAVTTVVLERRSSGEPDDSVRVCPACHRQIEAGELPLVPADSDHFEAADAL
jgi:hypothetical protein